MRNNDQRLEDATVRSLARSANMTIILGLSLVHFIGDFYVAFVNPLLPLFAEKFSLSLVQVGFIAGLNRLLAFVVQPSVGYLADRYRTRFFVLGGVGIANGAQVYSSAVDRQNGVLALDLGAGVKRMIAKSMAARLEYRFISYSVPASRNWNDHTFLAGISIFF